MVSSSQDKKKDENRKRCEMITLAVIGIAVLTLLLVVMWRFLSPTAGAQDGGGRRQRWRGARGGSCGCMAGQV